MRRLGPAAPLDLAVLFGLVAHHKRIGLAVSGGADSLALMLLAKAWAGEQATPPEIFVYSVDHCLRPEAAAEAAFVADVSIRLGLRARVLNWAGDKPVTGVQAAARAARYRLMGRAMADDGVPVLLTGHHRTDQAETVLMRLAHGTGLAGLAGMAALSQVEGVAVFRPLLDVDPAVLHQWVAKAGLIPVEDPSNGDDHYERVRWRQALPALDAMGLDAGVLTGLARRAAEADAALEAVAEAAFERLVRVDGFGALRIDRQGFADEAGAIATKLVDKMLSLAGGKQRRHVLGPVETLTAALLAPDGFRRQTLLGAIVHRSGKDIWVVREPGRAGDRAMAVPAGATLVWDNRFAVSNRLTQAPVLVRMAHDWNRKAAETFVGIKTYGPIEGLRASPVVLSESGQVLGLGQHRLDPCVDVAWMSPYPIKTKRGARRSDHGVTH